MMKDVVHADRIQLAYARILGITSTVGMVFIAAGFLVYVFGLLPSGVPASDVAAYWHLRAAELHSQIPVPSGWDWIGMLNRGDALSYASIIYLASATIICLAVVVPVFMKEKDRIYTLISIIQVMVLVFAAAGILSSKH